MNIKDTTISKGFIAAGLVNASVLIFSRFFSNPVIAEFSPDVMSNFGLLMILVWGLAYISVAYKFNDVKWLVGVFAIEKLIYGVAWIYWMLNNNVAEVTAKDAMAGSFLSSYGIFDLIFFVFFLMVFFRIKKNVQNK